MQTLPLEKIRRSSNFIAQVSGDVGYLPRIHMLVVEYQLMEDRDNLIGVLYKFIVDPFNARPHAKVECVKGVGVCEHPCKHP